MSNFKTLQEVHFLVEDIKLHNILTAYYTLPKQLTAPLADPIRFWDTALVFTNQWSPDALFWRSLKWPLKLLFPSHSKHECMHQELNLAVKLESHRLRLYNFCWNGWHTTIKLNNNLLHQTMQTRLLTGSAARQNPILLSNRPLVRLASPRLPLRFTGPGRHMIPRNRQAPNSNRETIATGGGGGRTATATGSSEANTSPARLGRGWVVTKAQRSFLAVLWSWAFPVRSWVA